MNNSLSALHHFFVTFCLMTTSLGFPVSALAETDPAVNAQREACSKNSATYWDSVRNRCIQKVEAQTERHEVEDCGAIADLEQRKACHKKIAEKKSGLDSNPDSLPTGSTDNSMLMNGVASAYAIIGLLNSAGSGGKTSTCTSKKIFAVTAIAGLASDLWLKDKAKSAIEDLKNKYQIDVKNNAYNAQSKAFQYLKDEQETVKDIAGREKTRNMLLMLGYGAASIMAIYEMSSLSENPDCYKPNSEAADKTADKTGDKAKTGTEGGSSQSGNTATSENSATNATSNNGASQVSQTQSNAPATNTSQFTTQTDGTYTCTATSQSLEQPYLRFADPSSTGSFDPSLFSSSIPNNSFYPTNGFLIGQ